MISGNASERYMTWQNRRLHTLNLYAKYEDDDELQGTNVRIKINTLESLLNPNTNSEPMFYCQNKCVLNIGNFNSIPLSAAEPVAGVLCE